MGEIFLKSREKSVREENKARQFRKEIGLLYWENIFIDTQGKEKLPE